MGRRAGWFALWVLAALAVPVGIALALLAVDVLRAPGQLRADDRRFQTDPLRPEGLWDVGFMPRDASERLLALEDDLAYRRLAAVYAAVEPGKVEVEGVPELETLRAEAQTELARASAEETERERRSRLLTMRGVIALAERPAGPEERRRMLEEAASIFRQAVDLDPSNVDAKTNLEAALSAAEGDGS
jgi:hypothetical protein